ncbi:hypothetical protein EMIHUDRAFT_452331 [Emiliania huxleyi CCMP1516]|uniref:Uncharacterized protein n=2 Tax=Emiliania huxleyi TaxID=2903 RepID=A0A0D3IKT5_EMIH1|nr:hypothetical protein EMIHUDRAFT_452331 [Emiliania huxleyi CCMP1516]EOD11870.1 hypothetical protein EMIHUDRAFT_452331 [Emiliania huxleyi CCMP1516]|eukprot:XP_005764299.1 hypothetical protein EMIHUDRAFT_452331 [Emiliania huxleyi CCMP1516]
MLSSYCPTHADLTPCKTHLFLKEMRKTKTLEEKKKMLIERQAGGALSSTAPHAPLLSFAPHNRLWLRLSLRAAAAAPLRTIALSSLLRQAKMKAMPPDERKKMTSETKARAGLSLPSHAAFKAMYAAYCSTASPPPGRNNAVCEHKMLKRLYSV